MKPLLQISIFAFLLLVLLFFSCKKDEPVIIYEAGDQEFGWARGTKGGQEWEASGYLQYHLEDSSKLLLFFRTFTREGFMREDLNANEIPLSPGYYEVKYGIRDLGDGYVGGGAGIWGSDGDVLKASYNVNNDKDGFISIESVDTIGGMITISGEFELFYLRDDSYSDSSYPKRIEIKGGEFEVGFYQ